MPNTKIAIVEDEWTIAESLKHCLTNLDYEVTSIVETGEDAIKNVEKERPDLVLMDIILKGEMSGIDAARQISDRFDIPHIFLTAYANKEMLDQAKKTKPSGYLLKPFDEQELNASIEIALYKHKMEAEIKTKSAELKRINELFVGRELMMIKLKKEIEELKKEIVELHKEQNT